MASMLKNGRSNAADGLHTNGCSCCNPKPARRRAKSSAKVRENTPWKRLARLRTSEGL
jgi:hypothetical protein